MAMTYITRDGDVLDDVCWRHYRRADALIQVLEANMGLADIGPVLPAGVRIELPDIPVVAKSEVSLWD